MISKLGAVFTTLATTIIFIAFFYLQKYLAPNVATFTYRITVMSTATVFNILLLVYIGAVRPVYVFGDAICSALFITTTVALFIGPMFQYYFLFDNRYKLAKDKKEFMSRFWRELFSDFCFSVPIIEEVLYRFCNGNIWEHAGISQLKIIFISPFIFGFAHFHHFFEKTSIPWQRRLLISLIQVGFTSLFGFWTSFCWVKTHGLLTCIILHLFCNYMEFPDFGAALNWPNIYQRKSLYTAYIAGIIIFCCFTYIIAKY